MSGGRSYCGRSTVHAANGVCATSHPLASLGAIDILQKGGNAVDGAIAAAAILAVVEPMSTGIGGDCFALLSQKGELPPIALNSSGCAPAQAVADRLLAAGHDHIAPHSIDSVTIPGAVAGWCRLHEDYGRLDFAQILQPAIALAENGFALTPRIARDWARNACRLQHCPESLAIYLPRGTAPQPGEIFRLPALAKFLAKLATTGPDAFYRSEYTAHMTAFLRQYGSLVSKQDFACHQAEYVSPLAVSYRQNTIFEIPPNAQGVVALSILKALETLDFSTFPPDGEKRIHMEIEIAKQAFIARNAYLSDRNFCPQDLAAWGEDKFYGARRVEEILAAIDPDHAAPFFNNRPHLQYRDTVYLCVADRDRNVVSLINSLYFPFGAGFTDPVSGVCFQCRGAGFNLQPGHPNCLSGGKRPLHTLIPAMLGKNDRCQCAFGVMGGDYQPVGHARFVTNILDYGMDLQQAIDYPRVFIREQFLELEAGNLTHIAARLAGKGHRICWPDQPIGGGQAIWLDWRKGSFRAGSDFRKDGCAIGY